MDISPDKNHSKFRNDLEAYLKELSKDDKLDDKQKEYIELEIGEEIHLIEACSIDDIPIEAWD